jgi:hypothetical protein
MMVTRLGLECWQELPSTLDSPQKIFSAAPFRAVNPMDTWVSRDGAHGWKVSGSPWNTRSPAQVKHDFNGLTVTTGRFGLRQQGLAFGRRPRDLRLCRSAELAVRRQRCLGIWVVALAVAVVHAATAWS